MSTNNSIPPVPYYNPITDEKGIVTNPWAVWFRTLVKNVSGGGSGTNPMTAIGDMIYGGSAGAETRLAGNTTTAKEFLTQTGNGSASASPQWGSIQASDLPLVPVTGGGTGKTTASAAFLALAPSPGTSGNVLTSTGSAWISSAPTGTNTNIDGGTATSNYGGSNPINGGTA